MFWLPGRIVRRLRALNKAYIFIFALTLLVVSAALYLWLFYDLPSLADIPNHLASPSIHITDRNGKLLYELIGQNAGRQTSVDIKSIPLDLQQATIATEDVHFYQNAGIDLGGIARAFWINLRGGETIAGGSTITQQVARNLLFNTNEKNQRTLRRKLRETFLAWLMSRQIPKSKVLELYLNQIYYGGMAYGVEAASETYFGKPVIGLDLAECALIAGLPQAPALYNPFTNFETAKQRQIVVLQLMVKAGFITEEQSTLAQKEQLILAETPYPLEAPHFVMMVRNQLDEILLNNSDQSGLTGYQNLTIRTTLDLDWQHLAERAVQQQVEKLKHTADGLGHNVNSAALVSLDTHTGEVYAFVGSADYFDARISGAINMAITPRQPGSALKPLVYAEALNPTRPDHWTAGTMILDVSTSFTTHDGKVYIPSNYDGLEHGPVSVRQALASSLNIPAVITLNHVGLPSLFSSAAHLGITTLKDPKHYDLSVALGGGAVSLLELTDAYAAFANGGYHVQPQIIEEITDESGAVIYQPKPPQMSKGLDDRVAWLISNILSDDEARYLGFGKNSILNLGFPAAVKTGTTTNFHDNWTVGFTPDLVTGVWVGNTNYEPMRNVTGLTGAAPIWAQFMRGALKNSPHSEFQQPDGFIQVKICALSGMLPSPDCPYTRYEWYIQGTQPTVKDNLYKTITIDIKTGRLAAQNTPAENKREITVLDLPVQASAWARSAGTPLLLDYTHQAQQTDSETGSSQTQLEITTPTSNTSFRIAPSLPNDAQRIPIEVIGHIQMRQVILFVDDIQVTQFAQPPYRFWWQLIRGSHTIHAQGITASGEKISSPTITIIVE